MEIVQGVCMLEASDLYLSERSIVEIENEIGKRADANFEWHAIPGDQGTD